MVNILYSYDKTQDKYIFAAKLMTKEELEAYLISQGHSLAEGVIWSESEKQIQYKISTEGQPPAFFPSETPSETIPFTPVGYVLEPDKEAITKAIEEKKEEKDNYQAWLDEYWDSNLMAFSMVLTYMLLNTSMTDILGLITKLGILK